MTTVVSAGQTLIVSSGMTLSDVTVDGTLIVLNGGKVVDETLRHGTTTVSSGGSVSQVTIASAVGFNELIVKKGGIASGGTVGPASLVRKGRG